MSGRRRIIGVHPGVLDGTEEFSRIEDPDDDNVIYMQNAEPISLYCNDTWDGETFRACHQVQESLLDFAKGGVDVIPGLGRDLGSLRRRHGLDLPPARRRALP